MAAIDDGGPAFPTSWTNEGERNEQAPNGVIVPPGVTIQLHGMTLRDYFAAQAMVQITLGVCVGDKAFYAQEAYKMADAMLRARKVPA